MLVEAERHGMLAEEAGGKFNAITFLAQYLMRNNPVYSHLSESSPYIRGLRKVSETLQRDVFELEANK